jgi:hypothetical protein
MMKTGHGDTSSGIHKIFQNIKAFSSKTLGVQGVWDFD